MCLKSVAARDISDFITPISGAFRQVNTDGKAVRAIDSIAEDLRVLPPDVRC